MNNSFLIGTDDVLGYCSIIPQVGEEHMFGDRLVKFAYSAGDSLFFTDDTTEINEDEEAEYIQNYLLSQGTGFISTDDIKLVIKGQFEYMKSIGLAVEIEE